MVVENNNYRCIKELTESPLSSSAARESLAIGLSVAVNSSSVAAMVVTDYLSQVYLLEKAKCSYNTTFLPRSNAALLLHPVKSCSKLGFGLPVLLE